MTASASDIDGSLLLRRHTAVGENVRVFRTRHQGIVKRQKDFFFVGRENFICRRGYLSMNSAHVKPPPLELDSIDSRMASACQRKKLATMKLGFLGDGKIGPE